MNAKDIIHIVWFEIFLFVSDLTVGGNGNGGNGNEFSGIVREWE